MSSSCQTQMLESLDTAHPELLLKNGMALSFIRIPSADITCTEPPPFREVQCDGNVSALPGTYSSIIDSLQLKL